jgi:hypothetical protein
LAGGIVLLAAAAAAPAFALEANEYRQFLGLDSRKLIWFLAQMHLFFAAFVLGVPLFAVIIEIVGWRNKDARFDRLAYEFTSLLSVAYATTAAFGGLLAFALFTLYPTFMGYMAGIFKDVMFMYALLFFAETFLLYLYYYGWDWLSGTQPFSRGVQRGLQVLGVLVLVLGGVFFFGGFGLEMRGDTRSFMSLLYIIPVGIGLILMRDRKSGHILIGILLNVAGTAIMQLANSWAGFMMSPAGVDATGAVTGSLWQAFENILATPIAVHRMLGNLAFGGLVAGSYAAVRFIGAKTAADKAHYDWMGYIANFVAIAALIPLPFAGYYLGREVYSNSAVMGNNMMGGDFSWTFIMQAMLVGSLFLISNYYLWSGMTRIPGSERYYKYIKYILGAIVVSFAVWLTPHNLPLTGSEVGEMGGSQYHAGQERGDQPDHPVDLLQLPAVPPRQQERGGADQPAGAPAEDRHSAGRSRGDRDRRPVRRLNADHGPGDARPAGGPRAVFPHRRLAAGVRMRRRGDRRHPGAAGHGQAGPGPLHGGHRLQRGDLPRRLRLRRNGTGLAVPAQRRRQPVPAAHQLPDPGLRDRRLPVPRRQGSRRIAMGKDVGAQPVRAARADLHHHHEHGAHGLHPLGAARRLAHLRRDARHLRMGLHAEQLHHDADGRARRPHVHDRRRLHVLARQRGRRQEA